MSIPLPRLMRHWREEEFSAGDTPLMYRLASGLGRNGATAAPLPRADEGFHAPSRRARAQARRLPLAAAGRRLDAASRSRCTAGAHVPGAVGRHQGGGAAMSGSDGAATRSSSRSARGWGPYNSAARRAAVASVSPRPPPPLVPDARQGRAGWAAAAVPEVSRRAVRDSRRGGETLPEVPAAVARYLRSTNLPLRVRVGDDTYLDALPWKSEPALERKRGAARGDDEVGLTHAAAAVAETGTLVLASGRGQSGDRDVPARDQHRRGARRGPGRQLRGRLGQDPRALRPAGHAAHGQFRLRPLPHRRHRRAAW